METNIGLSADNRSLIARSLCKISADEYLKNTGTRKAHWNVEGPDFSSMHKFFEQQYNQLEEIIDQVAERIREPGHYAPATLKQFLELTHRSEDQRNRNDASGYIRTLLADHESTHIYLREKIKNYAGPSKDIGTNDYITALMKANGIRSWRLRTTYLIS